MERPILDVGNCAKNPVEPAHSRHTPIFFVDVRERRLRGISNNYSVPTFVAIIAGMDQSHR